MLSILLALVSGNCVQPVQQINHGYYVQQFQQQYVPLYFAQPLSYGGDAERIRKLEDAVEQLTIIASQQQQLIQMGGPMGLQGPSQLETKSKAIIAANCLSCHKGETPKGDLDLSLGLTIGEKLLMAETVASGSMPPNKELREEDKRTLFEWSREDAAAVKAFLRGK